MAPKLSAHQISFLRLCEKCPQDSWRVGAATISSLRKLGFIEKRAGIGCSVNVITDAGRAYLANTEAH